MTQLVLVDATERERLKRQWLGAAAYARFGFCQACGRNRTDDDKPLRVIRAERSRRGYECLECFVARARRPRRRRAA